MSHDILTTLQEKMPEFSKGQRRIAHYILNSYDKAAFMTANCLGKNVGVSESTVVRFAVDLGFDGYPSMQKSMQEMVLQTREQWLTRIEGRLCSTGETLKVTPYEELRSFIQQELGDLFEEVQPE